MGRINPYKLFVGAFIPNWLCSRTEISQGAKLTYAQLSRHAGNAGVAWPSRDVLASEIGTSTSQVDRYVKELERAQLLETEQQGLRRTNRYFFLEHAWMTSPDSANMRTQDSADMTGQESANMRTPSVRESLKVESEKIDRSFDDFYKSYPRHEAKADALKAWKALNPDEVLIKRMAMDLKRFASTERRFVPLPATYLRGRRWEDEPQLFSVPSKPPEPRYQGSQSGVAPLPPDVLKRFGVQNGN